MAYSASEDYPMANRFRLRFTFWLDMRKTDEAQLAETIETLKLNRSFAATIRDGIRLICDLRAGQTDVLFELFPWIKDAPQSVSTMPVDRGFQEQIARLEALLLAQGNVPIQTPLRNAASEKAATESGKSLIEITGSTGKVSAEAVAKNFLNSMKDMASGFFD
jgi:hypothetical protein